MLLNWCYGIRRVVDANGPGWQLSDNIWQQKQIVIIFQMYFDLIWTFLEVNSRRLLNILN